MESIPFEVGGIKGVLSRMDKGFPPKNFHVYQPAKKGAWYLGQLIHNKYGWYLPDSKLEPLAEELGAYVVAWVE